MPMIADEDIDAYLLIGALRCDAVTATGVFDGAINSETGFAAG
jgi:hypothetical protein